jgi:hypothetical protein
MKELALYLMSIGFVRIQRDIISVITWNSREDVEKLLPNEYEIQDTWKEQNNSTQYDIRIK